jgi:hydroxyacylglutathione hydrolase
MLLDRIESRGLAHFSYLIGDATEAVVIDPRRDCDVYVDKARKASLRIVHILETHRNEDYVVGSLELAARTGAEIWHAEPELDYGYGKLAKDGQAWKVGSLQIQAMYTPGHTPGSISYILKTSQGDPWMLFSGDTVFAGDVGRVDLSGKDRMKEMAMLLHASIIERILPLGDDIILCPAHGAGSVCGSSIAERTWTTIGIERRLNPRLRLSGRDEFVASVARQLERPPYFRMMEKLNLEGATVLGGPPVTAPLSPDDFAGLSDGGTILDTRSELAFGAAHVPGSLFIWHDGVPSYAGWFLPHGRSILLVMPGLPGEVVAYLVRLGFDDLAGYLAGGMLTWHMTGRESQAVKMLTVQGLCRQLDAKLDRWILDVRSQEELESDGRIPNAQHIHLTLLPSHLEEIPKDRTINIFCGSGLRSMTAASMLVRAGWEDVSVVLGGLAGWNSRICPIQLMSSDKEPS